MTPNESKHRSGWRSSKLHLCLIGMVLLTSVFIIGPRSDAAFDALCFAVVSLVGVYSGSRVGETFANRPARTQYVDTQVVRGPMQVSMPVTEATSP